MTNYWKIRALGLIASHAQDACAKALDAFFREMREAGFDPAVPHRYDDEAETITVVSDGNTDRSR